jgi:nucleoid-associated protein YgaU
MKKPNVTPPASYKVPTLPTLAALGILTAASALTTGCSGVITQGEPPIAYGGDISILGGIIEMEPALPEPATPALPTQYRVGSTKGGDTLSGIAQIFYGYASKWPVIFEANRDIIKDPNIIRDGMLITIPKLGE